MYDTTEILKKIKNNAKPSTPQLLPIRNCVWLVMSPQLSAGASVASGTISPSSFTAENGENIRRERGNETGGGNLGVPYLHANCSDLADPGRGHSVGERPIFRRESRGCMWVCVCVCVCVRVSVRGVCKGVNLNIYWWLFFSTAWDKVMVRRYGTNPRRSRSRRWQPPARQPRPPVHLRPRSPSSEQNEEREGGREEAKKLATQRKGQG